MNLKKYKNLFGPSKKGIHSYRLFGVAVADVIMTFIGAIIISWIFRWNPWITLIVLFLLGIFLHHIFGVRTTVDKLLFPDNTM